jgi:hypothetical protein
MRRVALTAAFLTLSLCAETALAQVYRWEDAQGEVHVTNEPPPRGARVLGMLDGNAGAADRKAKAEAPRSASVQRFDLGHGHGASLSVPDSCQPLEAQRGVLAGFACASAKGEPEGMLTLERGRHAVVTGAEFAAECRAAASAELKRDVERVTPGLTVRGIRCDAARRWAVLTGSLETAKGELEVESVILPVADGFLRATAVWPPGSPRAAVQELRRATQSLSVPDEYLAWPKTAAAAAARPVAARVTAPDASRQAGASAAADRSSDATIGQPSLSWISGTLIAVVLAGLRRLRTSSRR